MDHRFCSLDIRADRAKTEALETVAAMAATASWA